MATRTSFRPLPAFLGGDKLMTGDPASGISARKLFARESRALTHAASSPECVFVLGTGCVPRIQVNEAPPLPHTPEGPLGATGITLEGSVGTVGSRGPKRSWFLSDPAEEDQRLPGGGGILTTFSVLGLRSRT